MNERIKRLALQAGGGLSCIAEPLEHPWKFSELELTKFAELIISECAALAKSKSERIEEIKTEDHDDQIHLRSLAWQFEEFGYEIKKHFGVKE